MSRQAGSHQPPHVHRLVAGIGCYGSGGKRIIPRSRPAVRASIELILERIAAVGVGREGERDEVVEALVVSLVAIVLDVLADDAAKVPFTKRDDVAQAINTTMC